jgi:hypothetical protein
MCSDFVYSFYMKRFSFSEELNEILLKMYTCLHVTYQLFFSDFNQN